MTNEPTHYPGSVNGAVWRPISFNGITTNGANLVGSASEVRLDDPNNKTGGYVTDDQGNIYRNTMAYAGRPTHYYDFSTSSWKPIPDNHDVNQCALPLGNWKAEEYAWHARALGVTIYTVGYGVDVLPAQQILLATVANSTNTTAGNPQTVSDGQVTSYTPGIGTNIPFNANQPIGQQFYATTPADISNDFYQVGTAINSALTQ